MQFKVPQNIDMPDRILGPLTMLQFIYAVIGGGLAYVAFMSLPSPLNYLVAILVALTTLALIFLKINERPFSLFLVSLLRFMSSPRERIWHKGSPGNLQIEIYKSKKEDRPEFQSKHLTHEQIRRIARQVDSGKTR